jgi:putative ABC transport system permease protein
MGRLAWSQVRFRLARTLALITGVLVAATAFTVLTAASRTAQVRTLGTVSANFKAAYDILIRPKGARTAEESRNPPSAWYIGGGYAVAMDDEDSQYRTVTSHLKVGAQTPAAVAAGILITATAALLPAALLRRLPAAHLLAEE